MSRPSVKLLMRLALLAAVSAAALACKPKIGDDCKISTDCSAAGDRLCDITAPGGYCTMFNCEPGTCPDGESLCVEFGAQRGSPAQCQDQQSPSPYARTFCMETCDSTSDCRGGYKCVDLSQSPNDWDAVLIDKDRGHKVCVVPFSAADAPPMGEGFGDVCSSQVPEAAPSDDTSPADGASGAAQGGSGG